MNFKEYLNQIYTKLNCTQTELCNASQISVSTLSRYLSDDREPSVDSEQLISLARGIHVLAVSKGLSSSEFEYDNLLLNFNNFILQKEAVFDSFADYITSNNTSSDNIKQAAALFSCS